LTNVTTNLVRTIGTLQGPDVSELGRDWISLDAKAATVSAKHYGSREAMIEAKKRSEIREVAASNLA
jgi:hypothetical protein